MELHNDHTNFFNLIEEASKFFNISANIVEKDYWFFYCIKQLSSFQNIIFKGSTVSRIICDNRERYPNDIDMLWVGDLNQDIHSIGKEIQRLYKSLFGENVRTSCPEENLSQWTWYMYNSVMNSDSVRRFELECFVHDGYNSVKTQEYCMTSMIGDYLKEKGLDSYINEYNLSPYTIRGTTADHMFVEKIFALPYACDRSYHRVEWRKYEMIRDLIILMRVNQVKELLDDRDSFNRICRDILIRNDNIHKTRFGIAINEKAIFEDNIFSHEKVVELKRGYYEYNEMRRYNIYEDFRYFEELCEYIEDNKHAWLSK